ncbi:MAG: glycosyltransferase family 2 protein [Bacteroidota bacterium]
MVYIFGLKLSVIIVNYNVKRLLEQCLHSVLRAASGVEVEVWVVDNASTDDSKADLPPKFPEVKFIWNTVNVGFSKANNQVLPQATGEYILFLNPDTLLPEDTFKKCISFFEQQENCGALGVRMIDGSGKFLKESKRGFPSPWVSLCKMLQLYRLFPQSETFAKYYEGHLPEWQSNRVEVLSGAFMMLSQKALQKVQGFDERFFMYGEDIDLSCRIQEAGLFNYYFPEITIIHYKGESTAVKSLSYINHFYGAMELFAQKHFNDSKVELFFLLSAIKIVKTFAQIKIRITK